MGGDLRVSAARSAAERRKVRCQISKSSRPCGVSANDNSASALSLAEQAGTDVHVELVAQALDRRSSRRRQDRATVGRDSATKVASGRSSRTRTTSVSISTLETIGTRRQLERSEHRAKSGHLSADRDLCLLVVAQRHAQLGSREPVGRLGDQEQQLAVPQAESGGGRAVTQRRRRVHPGRRAAGSDHPLDTTDAGLDGLSRSMRSSASTAATVARTRVRLCGVATSAPPVRSSTPSTAPVSGSWIGAAEQLHGVTCRARCSGPKICTGRSRASAVPGALVPALTSLQSAPGTKCIASALSPQRRLIPRPTAAAQRHRSPRRAGPSRRHSRPAVAE